MTQELPLLEWSFILTLLQLDSYLTNPELITLSLTNKYLRLKLKPLLYLNIYPSKFFNSKLIQNYGDFYISKETLRYNIKEEFEGVRGFVKGVKLNYKSNPIYNSLLIDYFKSLTHIYFNGLIIQGDQINLIFKNLPHLESLKLKANEILIYQNSNYNQTLQLPQSLKKLKLKNNATHFTNQLFEGMSFIQARSHFTGFCPSIVLEKDKNYPNLRDFRFHFENSQSGLVLEDLLSNNMQLNKVTISGYLLTPNLFKILSNFPSLYHVNLKPNYYSIDHITTYVNYNFSKVTTLNLKLLKNLPEELVNYIIEPFLASTTKLNLPYSQELTNFYNYIIEKFYNVKELVLIGQGKFNSINGLKIGKNVKYLEIQNLSIIRDCDIISNLLAFSNVYRINISFDKRNKSGLGLNLNEYYESSMVKFRVIEYSSSKVIYRV